MPRRAVRTGALGRLAGRGAARGGDGGVHAGSRLGRARVPLGLDPGHRRPDGGGRAARGVRARGAARPRADPPLRAAAQLDGLGERCMRGARRDGDVRDDRVRPALRAGRDRDLRDVLGSGADTVHARCRDDEHPLRPDRLPDRALPSERARRAARAVRGDAAPVAHEPLHDERRRGPEHGHRWRRAGDDDAGLRACGSRTRCRPAIWASAPR